MASRPGQLTDNSDSSREDKTMAQFQIEHSVAIERPAETVFQYVIDVTKQHEWRPDIDGVEDYSGDPDCLGLASGKWSHTVP